MRVDGLLRRFFSRLVNVLRPGRSEDDLSRELAAHIALLEDEFQRRGMTADEARRAARLALGGVEQTKDLHRDARSYAWLDDTRRDVSHAARLLRRNPVFALTASLSLAIAIGANTAIFTVVNALLLRNPVGVTDPGQLVDIGVSRGDDGFNPGSYPTYLDIRRDATTLVGVYAYSMFPQAMSLEAGANAAGVERIFGQFVTTNYFTVLGAVPATGRLFGAGESDRPGASPVVVLGHGFWKRRFDKDPAVVGQALRLNGQSFTVVGVAREEFQGTGVLAADVWLPLNMVASGDPRESVLTARRAGWLVMGGRLKPGVSMPQAAAELAALGRTIDHEYPDPAGARGLRLLPSSRVPGNRGLIAAFVALLTVIVSLVLVVACANVAGILLARGASRRREIAIRLAIGAGRVRLVRQLLTETMMLFLLAGAAGLLLARVTTSLIVALLPSLPFPITVTLALDGRVIAFTTGLSLAAALVFGLAPAREGSKVDLVASLKDDPPGPAGRSRLRDTFVIAQVAFSILLVVVGGLFVRALQRAGSMDPGFDPHGVQLVSLDLSMAGYSDTSGPRFWRELVERVRHLPDVQAATVARVLPGGFEGIGLGGVAASGVAPPVGQHVFGPSWNIVEPGYFATLRIPLIAGRDFSATDLAGVQPVAIVGEGVARRLWPGQNAIGRLMSRQAGRNESTLLVVGVARDVKSSSLVDGLADSFVYLPLQQHYTSDMTSTMTIAARTARGERIADQMRVLIGSMDPSLPIVRSETLETSTALGFVPQRLAASLSGSLGIVGLLLAGIGIYGVTAYTVARRTREIGIRVALGAPRRDIVGMILGQGMSIAGIGAALGSILAAAASQLLTGFLFGIPSLDPIPFAAAVMLLLPIGLAACYVPARRATKVDPLVALRYE